MITGPLDGGPATQFLAEIKNQIEILSPELLNRHFNQ